MRYVASTRNGSLLMSSIRTVAKEQDIEPPLAQRVHDNSLQAVEDHETGIYREYTQIDKEMAALFLQWAAKLDAGDGKAAAALASQIDLLAVNHPFTYPETKALFHQHRKNATTAQAMKNYRKVKGDDPAFGIVENRISGSARVAIFGDWGTGTEDSKELFAALMQHDPDAILHLGDIYEAGVPLEVEEFFVEPIKAVCRDQGKTRPPIFTIPGNHEYFSGGAGFFELIDVINGEQAEGWRQEASFYCLRSDDGKWQFLGADTGITCIEHPTSPGLIKKERDWLRARIAEFGGKTVLMTHHQLMSADSHLNGNVPAHSHNDYRYFNRRLVDAFDATPEGGQGSYFDKIDLWLWGHDHWFIPYAADLVIPKDTTHRPTLRRGQLLGGSARETTQGNRHVHSWLRKYVQKDAQGRLVLPDVTPSETGVESYYNHTYAILDLGSGEISYYQTPAWNSGEIYPLGQPIRNPLLCEIL